MKISYGYDKQIISAVADLGCVGRNAKQTAMWNDRANQRLTIAHSESHLDFTIKIILPIL